jgi:hypothetical protein
VVAKQEHWGKAMDIEKKRFKKMFPKLSEEMETGECGTQINSVRTDPATGEKAVAKRFRGYIPDAIDFLRRCDRHEQAEEIISYLEKRGEITQQYAMKLRKQLKEKGVRSFGSKKENDYYLKQDADFQAEQSRKKKK